MRKWRFRKDLMPNAGGGVDVPGKDEVDYSSIDDPFAKYYNSKSIRFGAMTQVLCGAFVCLFGNGLYIFGVKGWLTEYFVHLCMIGGFAYIVTGIWGSETAKYTTRWKIIVNMVNCCACIVVGLALVIAACTAIPVEYQAQDKGWIREVTHMQARVVLVIFATIADVLCLVTSVSQLRLGFCATLECCRQLDDDNNSPLMV